MRHPRILIAGIALAAGGGLGYRDDRARTIRTEASRASNTTRGGRQATIRARNRHRRRMGEMTDGHPRPQRPLEEIGRAHV